MVETATKTVYIMRKGSGGRPNAIFLKNYSISFQSGKMVETATKTVYIMRKGSGNRPNENFFENL